MGIAAPAWHTEMKITEQGQQIIGRESFEMAYARPAQRMTCQCVVL